MLEWTRELPIEGQPEDVVQIVDASAKWLSTSPIPKLFINGDPAGFLIGPQRDFCRAWPNQEEVTVRGAHFLPEDSPIEVGDVKCTGFIGERTCRGSHFTDGGCRAVTAPRPSSGGGPERAAGR
jgi:hypothetical protein